MTIKESTFDDVTRTAVLSSGVVIRGFHKSIHCAGDVCPVHKPSQHPYRHLPLTWDPQMFMFLRVFPEPIMGFKGFPDPDDYNYLKNKGRAIMRNAAICTSCHEEIVSEHRHHFATCSCGQLAVDGGHHYLRRVGRGFKETSIVFIDNGKAGHGLQIESGDETFDLQIEA